MTRHADKDSKYKDKSKFPKKFKESSSNEAVEEELREPKQIRERLPKEIVKEKLRERKKLSKQLLKAKRARLVVSNLPFKASEESLKEYFEQYGEVETVDLLRKCNGKLVGCCFVQFKLVQKAAKARHYLNGKEFLGRKIIVEFAKAKDKFVKEENRIASDEKLNIKEEKSYENVGEIKEESENVAEIKTDHEDSRNDTDQMDTDDEYEEAEENNDNNMGDKQADKKPHVISNDVTEGRTVFIKNVPFDATNDDLKQCMMQFGPVFYALVCVDKYTEHSKGTAFVKFVNKEDADKALNAGTELTILGNVLDCHPALDKNVLQQKVKDERESKKEPKDSRNLYLVKEGVILAGGKAAQGVSASDMAKRLQIEQYKTQMLRNLNMFVARDRLVIHNLPTTWDDKKLRILMQKYGGPGAIVREARIMRDMQNLDAKGVGKSKEYGFVSFTRHENALQALRSLNNNPDIFSSNKRPIITFSIENKLMVNARLKRLEKSRLNNPTSKTFQSGMKKPNTKSYSKVDAEKFDNNKILKKAKGKRARVDKTKMLNDDAPTPQFSGVSTEPGKIEKMRSRYKLAAQAKMHYENLKKEKRKKKTAKKSLAEKKKEFIKQPKQKINKIKQSDEFSKLVNSYKKTLLCASTVKKSKWYE